jgi:ParB-like chromosome segregation protein Spo0J
MTDTEIKFHPLADIFPLMEGEAFDALVADIKANGLREPIMLYEGKILDGRNRYRACLEAGVEVEWERWMWEQTANPVAYVISKNIHRRHLTAEQKRDLIAKLVKAKPEKSDRQIAETVKASPTTVGKIRGEMESTVQSGQLPEKRIGKDGKARKKPAKKTKTKKPAEVTITDEQGRTRRLKEGEFDAIVAKEQKEAEEAWREIECFTDALIDTDANLAQRLFAILRDDVDIEGRSASDVLTGALEFGLKLATQREARIEDATPTDQGAGDVPSEVAPKKRGRPKGSKNKPKSVVEPPAAVVTDQVAAVADVSALPNHDLGIPEFLRRTPAVS